MDINVLNASTTREYKGLCYYVGRDSSYRRVPRHVVNLSVLGNPFPMKSEDDRAAVCSKYKEYFEREVKKEGAFRNSVIALYKSAMTNDISLVCWCAPKECHADVIKSFLCKHISNEDTKDPEKDGVNHINVYSKGRTALGRFLSNFANSPIETEDGHFSSIEGYWYWLGTHDDHLRSLYGYRAKAYGRKLHSKHRLDKSLFEDKIKKAITIKITNNDKFKELFANSSLKFEHYYVFGGKVIDAGYKWILEHLTKLREEVKSE